MFGVPSVLVVDDDKVIASALQRALRCASVTCVYNGHAATKAAATARFDAAIIDLLLDGESGLDLVRRLRTQYPLLKIGLMTGAPTMEVGFSASEAGADAVFAKPLALPSLTSWVVSTPRMPKLQSLEQTKRSYVKSLLESCNGNKSETARRLNIRRTSLQRMLHKWS